MSSEMLAGLAGLLLSLACSYLPGVAGRYQALDPTGRRLVMLGLLLLVGLGAFGLACAGWLEGAASSAAGVACTQNGAAGLVRALLAALVANQSAYALIRPARPAGAAAG